MIAPAPTPGRNSNIVVEPSLLLLPLLLLFLVLREIGMDMVKSSAELIVLPEEAGRFQALKPRWQPRRAPVCVSERA